MAQVTIPEQQYQTLTALAALHPDMTPDAYIAGVIAGQIAIEADIETLEVLHDPEAMAAVRSWRAAGEPQEGRSIDDVVRDLGIDLDAVEDEEE